MSDNWVVQNLEKALGVWNDKLTEIWQLVTQPPQEFRGGAIWPVILQVHGALQAIGYALLVLFFVVGVVKTCGSSADVKLFREHKQITGACLWLSGHGQALFLYPLEILRSGHSKPAIREVTGGTTFLF